MEKRENLASAVRLAAWGYIFLHLDINLFVINIFPDWAAYIMFIKAIAILGGEDETANLLRPLGVILALWEGVKFVLGLMGAELDITAVNLIASVVSLYFHFQFLTNLASLAERYDCPQEGRILTLRTVRTVLMTIMALPIGWDTTEVMTIIMVIINLIVALWICMVLFSLKNSLLDCEEESEE